MARYQPRHARSAPRGRRALIVSAILVAGALTVGFVAGPADAASSRVLRIGSRGADVLAVERRLAGLHYDVGRVDGCYALHGSWSAPAYPASHGCVRVTIAAMDRLYNGVPVGMPVKVYR